MTGGVARRCQGQEPSYAPLASVFHLSLQEDTLAMSPLLLLLALSSSSATQIGLYTSMPPLPLGPVPFFDSSSFPESHLDPYLQDQYTYIQDQDPYRQDEDDFLLNQDAYTQDKDPFQDEQEPYLPKQNPYLDYYYQVDSNELDSKQDFPSVFYDEGEEVFHSLNSLAPQTLTPWRQWSVL